MQNFYYDLSDFGSYSKSEQQQEANQNKKIKTTDGNEEKLLIPVEYQPLILAEDKISQLKSKILTTNDKKIRYGVVFDIIKSKLINWSKDIVQLPNLCLTSIDENRFKFDPNSCLITMINRKNIVDNYVSFIQTNKLLYLYGLKGIGKSFIIYQVVAKLMKMVDRYRVIYINQSDPYLIEYVLDTIKAIVFYDCQKEEFKSKFEQYMSISIENFNHINYPHIKFDPNYITTIISMISSFYSNETNIELIFVLDQINLILRDRGLQEQFRFLESIVYRQKTIVSASANNEIEMFKNVQVPALQWPPIQLSLEEFNAFLSIYPNGLKHVKTVGDANQVLSFTGGVPLEISYFLSVENPQSLDDMMKKYKQEFTNHLNMDRFSKPAIRKWYNKLPNDDKTLSITNIARCVFKQSLNDNNRFCYDKRLFSLEYANGSFYLKPFSCLAMDMVLNCYSAYLQIPLSDEFRAIMYSSSGYNSSTRADCVQVYIIQSLCLGMLSNPAYNIEFDVHNYASNQIVKLTMRNFEIIRFAGLRAPSIEPLTNLVTNKLYVPLDENYPGFGFFYFECKTKSFYCFQITNQDRPMEHVIENDNRVYSYNKGVREQFKPNKRLSKAIDEWIKYLPTDIKFFEIWMLNKEYLDAHSYEKRRLDRLNRMNIIYFHTMTGIEALASYFQSKQ